MKNYLAYIRVSTVKQGERGSSLAEQKNAIEFYAERHGLRIAQWFEETETAAKQGRRRFSELLAMLKAGKADGLIIHKIDRSARNLRDWAELGDLIDRGVEVRFVSDNFDLLSRGGRLSADIQAVVAADYVRNLREEVKKGIYGRLKQGLYPFAAPIGYLNEGGGAAKSIDPIKGPLVRELFERYATGEVGFDALRAEMAQKGLAARNGQPLAKCRLTDILNNPFYMGVIRIRKTGETFSGIHEPLVSKALFDRVQAILRGKTSPKAKTHEFVFRQMIRCGRCKRRTLTGERQKGRVYYRCHGCPGLSWRADALERVIQDRLAAIRLSDQDMRDLRDFVADDQRTGEAQRERRRATATLQLAKIDQRLERLTDLLLDESIDTEAYNARRERLLLERQGLTDQLKMREAHSPLESLFERFERQNGELLRYDSLDPNDQRQTLKNVCSNFSVTEEYVAFELHSPYRELAELRDVQKCGPIRNDLRTFPEKVFQLLQQASYGNGLSIPPAASP